MSKNTTGILINHDFRNRFERLEIIQHQRKMARAKRNQDIRRAVKNVVIALAVIMGIAFITHVVANVDYLASPDMQSYIEMYPGNYTEEDME